MARTERGVPMLNRVRPDFRIPRVCVGHRLVRYPPCAAPATDGYRFAVRGSRFAVRGSRFSRWFAVRGSRFVVRGSWFVVRGSWFVVRAHLDGKALQRKAHRTVINCRRNVSSRESHDHAQTSGHRRRLHRLRPGGRQGRQDRAVYYDDDTNQPTWVTVHTGLFGTNETFVPVQGAELSGDRVTLGYDKADGEGRPEHRRGRAPLPAGGGAALPPLRAAGLRRRRDRHGHRALGRGTRGAAETGRTVDRDRDGDGDYDDVADARSAVTPPARPPTRR